MPIPIQEDAEVASRHSSDVRLVARRVAGLLVLIVGLIGLGVATFRYRHLNDLTAIAFAVGAALFALGLIAVVAVPMLEIGHRANELLVRWFGWVPGFGLVLTGITHFTDAIFFRQTASWLSMRKHPTIHSIHAEGVVVTVLGVVLIAAALLASYANSRMDRSSTSLAE